MTSDRPRLIVHIGPQKTATTTIQRALATNRDLLAEAGVLYPRSGVLDPRAEVAHHGLSFALQRRYPDWVRPERRMLPQPALRAVRQEMTAAGAACAIVSSETFADIVDGRQLAPFRQVFRGFDLLALVCRRDPVERLHSYYAQGLRGGNFIADGVEEFAQRVLGQERRLYDMAIWRQHFGEETVLELDYRSLCAGEGPAHNFLRALGFGDHLIGRLEVAEAHANPTPSGPVLALFRRLNGIAQIARPARIQLYAEIEAWDAAGLSPAELAERAGAAVRARALRPHRAAIAAALAEWAADPSPLPQLDEAAASAYRAAITGTDPVTLAQPAVRSHSAAGRLILHIGPSKTATSTIQTVLAGNARTLRRHGILYPQAGRASSRATAHHFLAFAVKDAYPDWIPAADRRDARTIREALRTEVAAAPWAKTVILSSEYLAAILRVPALRALAGWLPERALTVVGVRRPPVERALADYAQAIRADRFTTMDVAAFLERAVANGLNANPLAPWQRAVGPEAVQILDYAALTDGGEVVRNFLSALDLPEAAGADLAMADARLNARPDWPLLMLLRHLNGVDGIDYRARLALYQALEEVGLAEMERAGPRLIARQKRIPAEAREALRTALLAWLQAPVIEAEPDEAMRAHYAARFAAQAEARHARTA
ncbi:MAG: hypothetical protein AAGE18_03190 [Pseudomonadota bacterium]